MNIPRLDLDLLRTFVAIAEAGSLTRGACRVGRSQPAVSLQMQRLEARLGCRLMERSPRRMTLTDAGETLLGYGRRIIALSDEAVARLAEPAMCGVVRLGTPEDFATVHLPGVLEAFARAHPTIALEVTTDLTLNLLQQFQADEFDLVLVKRDPAAPAEGVRVWREALVWVCAERQAHAFGAQASETPLVVSPAPCVYRKRAQAALDAAGRRWRVAYTSTSLAGTQAAVRAGLGVAVLPRDMVPAEFATLGTSQGLPDLHDAEVALLTATRASPPVERLADHIVRCLS